MINCKIFLNFKMYAVVYFFFALTLFDKTNTARIGDACEINNYQGRCMVARECTTFKMESLKEITKFRKSNCGYADDLVTIVVCCPATESRIDLLVPANYQTPKNESMNSQVFCNKLGPRPSKKYSGIICHMIPGELAREDGFPQFAALAMKSRTEEGGFEFLCGGVLISENFVLTAAHCLKKTWKVEFVRFGTNDLTDTVFSTDVVAREQYRHPLFRPISKYHDIGLVELDKSILFTFYIWPACIYLGEDLPEETFDIAGFGLTQDDDDAPSRLLRKGDATEVQTPECSEIYKEVFPNGQPGLADGITSNLICANGPVCQGDSGSGLHRKLTDTYHKRFVVGIASYGYGCSTKLPSFFTRIFPYLNWIEEIVWPQKTE